MPSAIPALLNRSSLPALGRRHRPNGHRRGDRKDYERLNKLYRDYEVNVTMKDAESSDDGDDFVVVQLPINNTLHPTVKETVGSLEDLKLGALDGLRPPTPSAQTMQNGKYKESALGRAVYSENETIYSGFLWKRGKIVKSYKFGGRESVTLVTALIYLLLVISELLCGCSWRLVIWRLI